MRWYLFLLKMHPTPKATALLRFALAIGLLAWASCQGGLSSRVPSCGDGLCGEGESFASCPQDCGVCGNGVAEPAYGEECDGADLNGSTCEALGCQAGGSLSCTSDCLLDLSGCSLPCQTTCGNGVLEQGEECDCGSDPDHLPSGCLVANGEGGPCQDDCTLLRCEHELWDSDNPCDPVGPPASCCSDDWGNASTCIQPEDGPPVCALQCFSTLDCHYNTFCDPLLSACLPYYCGPNGYPASGELLEECLLPGGNPGTCVPIGLAEERLGLCYEQGSISSQDTCTRWERRIVTFPRNVGIEICEHGICADLDQDGEPSCLAFCNWEEVYDLDSNAAACGEGFNCVSESVVLPENPDLDSRGKRSADFAYCRPTEQVDPEAGITTCDLVNDQLISDRSTTCRDLDPSMTCAVISFQGGGLAVGSLIGKCQTRTAEGPERSLWEICDAAGDVCPSGSICIEEDFCALQPSRASRCIPYCDTEDASPCSSSHPELPPTSTCHSFSTFYRPGPTDCSTSDGWPTRLGLCACPVGGCT